MTTQQDCSIGIKKETVYGTGVTVDRHLEFLTESFQLKPEFLQGEGLRVGSTLARSSRRSTGKVICEGELEIEACTKAMGIIFEAGLGTGVATVIGATTGYQHVFKPTNTDPLPSYTIQKGLPALGGGAITAETFVGAVCSGFEIEAGNSEIVKVKSSWMAKDMTTATAYAAAVYAANAGLFTFVQGTIYVGNALTPPTASALATATGSPAANITDFSLSWDNGIDEDGFNLGGAGKRSRKNAVGLRSGTGKITAEYDSNVLRDAFIAQTRLTLLLTFQTGTMAGTSGIPETLQIYIPLIVLEGEIPTANGGDVITQSIDFTILDDGTATDDIQIVLVTTDTTI